MSETPTNTPRQQQVCSVRMPAAAASGALVGSSSRPPSFLPSTSTLLIVFSRYVRYIIRGTLRQSLCKLPPLSSHFHSAHGNFFSHDDCDNLSYPFARIKGSYILLLFAEYLMKYLLNFMGRLMTQPNMRFDQTSDRICEIGSSFRAYKMPIFYTIYATSKQGPLLKLKLPLLCGLVSCLRNITHIFLRRIGNSTL